MYDECQWRVKLLVIALIAMRVSAFDFATARECAEKCPPSIHECHPTDSGSFSCSMSGWLIAALVIIGVCLIIGIPVMCFGMYMCGMFACVGTFSEPRSRRKRRVSRRRKYWRRPWQIFRRGSQQTIKVDGGQAAVVQTVCYDSVQGMTMSSNIESVVGQTATTIESTENYVLQTPTTPPSQSSATPPGSVTLDLTQTAVSQGSNRTKPTRDRSINSSASTSICSNSLVLNLTN